MKRAHSIASLRVLSPPELSALERVQIIEEHARAQGVARAEREAVALLADAHRMAESLRASAHDTAVSLAIEIARRVIGHAAQSDPRALHTSVEGALDRLRRARTLRVRVHPLDADAARACVEAWCTRAMVPSAWRVESDPDVERGGALIESDIGRVDARIATQLESLERALRTP